MSKKQEYMAFFTYTLVVEADDYEQAEDLLHEQFEKYLADGLSAGDFAMSDVEEWGY